jgi:hypothetical protein
LGTPVIAQGTMNKNHRTMAVIFLMVCFLTIISLISGNGLEYLFDLKITPNSAPVIPSSSSSSHELTAHDSGIIELRVGAATLDLIPLDSTNRFTLPGYGQYSSDGVHDPITVRSVVVDDGKEKVAFVSVDLVFSDYSFPNTGPVADTIIKETGISPDHIFVSATHSHAAPASAPNASEVISKSILKANSELQPAQAYIDTGFIRTTTENRRNPERKPDGAITIIRFLNSWDKCIAAIVNFAVHPVILGPDNKLISADFVYYMRQKLEESNGGIAIYFNRHAGDINPPGGWNRSGGTFGQAEKFGLSLAEDILSLQSWTNRINIKIKVYTKRLEWAPKISIIDLGEAEILTIPGESLSSFGDQVDSLLHSKYKLFFSMTDGYIGYIVPKSEWGKCTSTWTSSCYEETHSEKVLADELLKEYRTLR